MAGICGLLEGERRPGAVALEARILRMANRLRQRGPDRFAMWVDEHRGLALAHRQLGGEGGAQPLVSRCGRFVLTADLCLHDTEDLVSDEAASDAFRLLEAIRRRGVDAVLPDLAGAFAFAVWDRVHGVLTLARDAFGRRPLFYARHGERLVFASEPGGLTAEPELRSEIDRDALATWLRDGYVAAPGSLIAGLYALPAGSRLHARGPDAVDQSPERFASPARDLATVEPFRGPGSGEVLERLLVPEVRRGAAILLQGGRGAVALAALARACSEKPVVTVTVGCDAGPSSTLARARAVAARLGTDHRELDLDDVDVAEEVPRLLREAACPLAEPAELAWGLACGLARSAGQRALHAEGAEALFAERALYRRVLRRRGLWARLRVEPAGIEARLAALRARHSSGWSVVRGGSPRASGADATHLDPVRRVIAADLSTRLAGAALPTLDRAAARAGLALDAPFLAPAVVRFAGSFWAGGAGLDGDRPLRALLARVAPRAALDPAPGAPEPPLTAWLRGPLRGWAASLLAPGPLREEGIFEPDVVTALWRDVCGGGEGDAALLWGILAFRAWWEDR